MIFKHETFTSDSSDHANMVVHAKTPVRDGSIPLDDMPSPLFFGHAAYTMTPQQAAMLGAPPGATAEDDFELEGSTVAEAFENYPSAYNAKMEAMKAAVDNDCQKIEEQKRKPKIIVGNGAVNRAAVQGARQAYQGRR
jgi:hypothetical protein